MYEEYDDQQELETVYQKAKKALEEVMPDFNALDEYYH